MLALRDYADIVLVDIVEGLPQGKSLDLDEMGRCWAIDTHLPAPTDMRRPPARTSS